MKEKFWKVYFREKGKKVLTKGGKGGIIWNCATEKAEGRKKKIKKVEKTSWQEDKKCGIINMLCRKQREKEIKKFLTSW